MSQPNSPTNEPSSPTNEPSSPTNEPSSPTNEPSSPTNYSSPTNSAASTTSSCNSSSLIPLPPTLQISQGLNSTQMVPLRTKDEVKLVLSLPSGAPKELLLDGICLDDELCWLLIESRLERVHLQKCTFGSDGPHNFDYAVEFLLGVNSLKHRSRFSVQFNDCTTQWILYDAPCAPEPINTEHVDSLIFILPGNIPLQSLLDNFVSLAIVPSKSDIDEPLPSQSKENLKSIIGRDHPNLKHLLLGKINFGDFIESFISILQLKLDLIYLYRCPIASKNLIWFTLAACLNLFNSIYPEKASDFCFTVPIKNHITRVVYSDSLPLLMPNSPDLTHGLISSLGQDLPTDSSLDSITFLALLPSQMGVIEVLSDQSGQSLGSIIDRFHPKLKYFFLMGMDLNRPIEFYIPISQLKLDLIYLSKCGFTTNDLIWTALSGSMELLTSLSGGEDRNFRFFIRTNDHTTQIVCHDGKSLLVSNSPDILHGLILPLGQDPPNGLSLVDISFLVFFPSRAGPGESVSSQSNQSLEFVKRNQCPNLKYLLSKDVSSNDIEEKYGSIRQLELEYHCLQDSNNPDDFDDFEDSGDFEDSDDPDNPDGPDNPDDS